MFVYNFHAYGALLDLHKDLAEAWQHKWLYLSPAGSFPPLLSHLLSRCFQMLLHIPYSQDWELCYFSFLQIPTKQSPDPLRRIPGAAAMQIPHTRLQSSPPSCWATSLLATVPSAFIISRSAPVQQENLGNEKQAQKKLWSVESTACCPAVFAARISTGSSAHSSLNPWFALRAFQTFAQLRITSPGSVAVTISAQGKKKYNWERTCLEWEVVLGSVQSCVWMRHLGPWLSSGVGSAGLTAELDGLRGLL